MTGKFVMSLNPNSLPQIEGLGLEPAAIPAWPELQLAAAPTDDADA